MELPKLSELETLIRSLRPALLTPPATGEVHTKRANDFVTEKDLFVQTSLKSALFARYPHIAFLGEEGESALINPEMPTFVLDPIDGTTNFVFSYGLSAVSLALLWKGAVLLGAVYNPYTDEFFSAERGGGAFLNGTPIHVLPATGLSEVLAAVGTASYYKEYADSLFSLMKKAYLSCIDLRRSGSAAIDLCYTACGRVGIYFEQPLCLWDYAAGALILEEAGGRITDWQGKPLSYTGKSSIAASNGALHGALLDLLSENGGV